VGRARDLGGRSARESNDDENEDVSGVLHGSIRGGRPRWAAMQDTSSPRRSLTAPRSPANHGRFRYTLDALLRVRASSSR
jgi:hypothetical protein